MDHPNNIVDKYERLRQQSFSFNLVRGKPGSDQIALSNGLDGVLDGDYIAEDGTDTRNYGGLLGIPEARQLGSHLLDVPADRVIAGGNSSLHLMYITADLLVNRGLTNDPLGAQDNPTAICPVPGYDRHFALTDYLGVRMVNVGMDEQGPKMDEVEEMVKNDLSTCMIWCVPKHSNPTGCTYSDEAVKRIAALPNLRKDTPDHPFYVLWDNAYSVHDFEEPATVLSSLDVSAQRQGTEDFIIKFGSTSKITFAAAGVGFLGSSSKVIDAIEKNLSSMTVGFDKVNQLRQARFLQNGKRVSAHMKKHAEILRPKFRAVLGALESELGNLEGIRWTQPTGGYFVSLDVTPGTASKVVSAAKAAGLALTPAGATFPYGHDPDDTNIRIAPTFASLAEVESAMEILTTCVKMVTRETSTP